MRISFLFTVALSLVPAFAAPLGHEAITEEPVLERRAGFLPVTGATGGVYPRLEVRQLHNNADAWNLFLLAMHSFMTTNVTAQKSYYQIAGIHGVPNIPWDGVSGDQTAIGQGGVGYCTHTSILFPTWHRIYTSLFEQIFLEQVQGVVNSWPNGATKTRYANVATTMRFPYFDWAAAPPSGLPAFPLIISTMVVSVVTPTGTQNIVNPLYRYDFDASVMSDSSNPLFLGPWNTWAHTLRYPNSMASNTISQENLVTSSFANNRLNVRDQLYSLFTQCTNYVGFGNNAASGSSLACSTSLEAIHDNIHSMLGGSNDGHMSWLWWAAFDPVFWLHHMNVDRILAMWQTIYPGQWVVAQINTGATYTIQQGSTVDGNSPLTPFHKDTAGNFWTSNQLQSWTQLGYTYPEFQNSDGSRNAIVSYVNKLYGPSATAAAGSSKRTAIPDITGRDELPANTQAGPTAPTSLLSTPSGQRYDYQVNLAVERFGLNSSFSIYLFLGATIDENPASWAFDASMVGSQGITVPSTEHKNHKVVVSGNIPLTVALTSAVSTGSLTDLSQESVVPYLQKNLQWRIATTSNVAVDASQVPSLEVSVVTSTFTEAASEYEFPVWGAWTTLPAITNSRAGGLNINATNAYEKARTNMKLKYGHL